MKLFVLAMIALLSFSSTAFTADSLALGVRAGAAVGENSFNTEVFGDLYLNRLVSIGATLGYTIIDRDTIKRDESVPITALFKIHLPTPFIKPYAGLGQALIFHDRRGTKGSVIGMVGLNLPMRPFFLNAEYRRQLDDKLDILAGGIGISF